MLPLFLNRWLRQSSIDVVSKIGEGSGFWRAWFFMGWRVVNLSVLNFAIDVSYRWIKALSSVLRIWTHQAAKSWRWMTGAGLHWNGFSLDLIIIVVQQTAYFIKLTWEHRQMLTFQLVRKFYYLMRVFLVISHFVLQNIWIIFGCFKTCNVLFTGHERTHVVWEYGLIIQLALVVFSGWRGVVIWRILTESFGCSRITGLVVSF